MRSGAFGCRSCGGGSLAPIVSLGLMPLANSLLRPEELSFPEERFPLDLVFCRSCSLVQITETVPPEKLFREYLYFSSFSDGMVRHARELAYRLIEERKLGARSLVVEVGSNDGYLLRNFVKAGIPVLGVEPAANVAEAARAQGVQTVTEFFGGRLARELRGEGLAADVLLALNVLAHVADLNGFVEGLKLLLRRGGVIVVEVPYVKELIDRCEFDTIYHEHLCYYSLTALEVLFRRHGLMISHAERIPVHGGSLRLFVCHEGEGERGSSVDGLLAEERGWGVWDERFYRGFGRRVEGLKGRLLKLLVELKGGGRRIAAYGAAAKGTVLLNYLNLNSEIIEFVADRNPHKQGLCVPGVRIPVLPPEALLERRPDYTLLLAWNWAEEVLEQQAEYRRRGGRFVIPIPEPRLV